jgi:glyoxylase-like metal-dependent hydrolase (beta-lactamase superfamily II)
LAQGTEFNHDHRQAIASLDRLANIDANVIIPGHGEPWRGLPSDAVEFALRGL